MTITIQVENMSKRRGDISELQVATHYLENGYEVFRNVCSTGLIDLVVVCPKTEEIFLYDVKTMTVYKDKEGVTTMYANASTEEQRKLGVEVVALYKDKIYTDPIRIKERIKCGIE
jgi:hypothetical protein